HPPTQPLLAVLSLLYPIRQLYGCPNVNCASSSFQHSVRPTSIVEADSYVDGNESIELRLHFL
ncbi:hypothetical protein CPC08DRAFT_713922, partial [Agrocybe pediades]